MRSASVILIFIFSALLFRADKVMALPDTLQQIVEKPLSGDSIETVNIFHKFTWDVNVKRSNGTVSHYVSQRPDSLFPKLNFDTMLLSAQFIAGPALTQRIHALYCQVKGSVIVWINSDTIIASGLLNKGDNTQWQDLDAEGYEDFLITDSLQTISIIFIPYTRVRTADMVLMICPRTVALEGEWEILKNDNQSRGKGLYYFAFGLMFLSLFVFFREKTEYLYFGMFCLFAAISFISNIYEWQLLYNLDTFFGVFSFEFLSIFFCKIILGREKSKLPLLIIVGTMLVCFLPGIRYFYVDVLYRPIPILLASIYGVLYLYTAGSVIYFLIKGIGNKQWEARVVVIVCLVPLILFVITFFWLLIAGETSKGNRFTYDSGNDDIIDDFVNTIEYIYPLAAVYLLGRRNGMAQRQLREQLIAISQLSEENLAKEREKQQILEQQKGLLEAEVTIRTAEIVIQKEEIEKQHEELKVEKRKSDDLLRNILPEEVAAELKEKGYSEARLFDNVTVLFTDFVNFTIAGEQMTPQALIEELHTCFKAFDEITTRYKLEKIKTIGDAYLAVCGLPVPDPNHAENVVRASLEISAFMADRVAKRGAASFAVRIGIHSGSVVAGIVGVKKFAYDVWGDTVNTAARLEQKGEAGKINVSQSTYELVKNQFSFEYRGEIAAKNKAPMKMYFVKAYVQ